MKGSLALYQALVSINVEESKAAAVVDALESDMQTQLATKADVQMLRAEMHQLKADVAQSELRLTIRMGVMLSAAVGLGLAAVKVMF